MSCRLALVAILLLTALPVAAQQMEVKNQIWLWPEETADRTGINGETMAMARRYFHADTGQAMTIVAAGREITKQYLVLAGPVANLPAEYLQWLHPFYHHPRGFLSETLFHSRESLSLDRLLSVESDSRLLPAPLRVVSGRAPVAGYYACTVYDIAADTHNAVSLSLAVGDSEILLFKVADFAFGDRCLPSGAYFDSYEVNVAPGDQLLIEMMSGDIDCALAAYYRAVDDTITAPADFGSAENDNADTGTNSRLAFTAPVGGVLTIIATHAPLPQRRSTPGGYLLTVERAPRKP